MTTVWRGSAFNCPSTGSQVANRLALYQKVDGVVNTYASGSCGNLSAVTTNVSTDGYCYTSVLTIPAVHILDGTTVICWDGVTGAVVGNDTVIVKMAGELVVQCYAFVRIIIMNVPTPMNPHLPLPVSPGPVGNMRVSSTYVNQLTVTWTPPTTGGVSTSYSVSINDSSRPVVIPDNGSSLYTHTFTGLISDTLYTASVVAINCAGTSNVTSNTMLTGIPSPGVSNAWCRWMRNMSDIGCVQLSPYMPTY